MSQSIDIDGLAASAYKARSATVGAAAVSAAADFGFTAPERKRAARAVITSRGAGVMVLWSGDTPTSVFGHYIGPNEQLIVEGRSNLANLKLIREAALDATVTITLEE